MRAERHLGHGVLEVEVRRRVVNGIAAEHDQRLDCAGVHVGDELAQGLELVHRRHFQRIGDGDGRADVAELLVEGHGQRVHGRRLVVAGNDDRRAAIRLQVFQDRW